MAEQRDEAWLKAATPEQISAAEAAGELDALLGRVVHTHPDVGSVPGLQRDQGWVDWAPPTLVAAAYDAGELDELLGRIPARDSDPAKPAQGLYGDGTIRTHTETPRGDIPQETGPAVTLPTGVDPKASGTVPSIPRG